MRYYLDFIFFPIIMLWRMLLFNLRIKQKMTFVKIDDRWFVYYREYPFNPTNLEMVGRADRICEDYSYVGEDSRTYSVFHVSLRKLKNYDEYITLNTSETASEVTYGRIYNRIKSPDTKVDHIWLCPVMLYTFGYYPSTIYFRKVK